MEGNQILKDEFNVELKDHVSVLCYSFTVLPEGQLNLSSNTKVLDILSKSKILERISFSELMDKKFFYSHVNSFFVLNDNKTDTNINTNFLVGYRLRKTNPGGSDEKKLYENNQALFKDEFFLGNSKGNQYKFVLSDIFPCYLLYHPNSSTMMLTIGLKLTGESKNATTSFLNPTTNGIVSFHATLKSIVSRESKHTIIKQNRIKKSKSSICISLYEDGVFHQYKSKLESNTSEFYDTWHFSSFINYIFSELPKDQIIPFDEPEANIFSYFSPVEQLTDERLREYLFWLSRKYNRDHTASSEYLKTLPVCNHLKHIYFAVASEGGVVITNPDESVIDKDFFKTYSMDALSHRVVWVYFLALFQRQSLLNIAKQTSKMALEHPAFKENQKAEMLNSAMLGEMLLKMYKFQLSSMFSQVTSISHINEYYLICKKQFMLEELYNEIDQEIKNLHAVFEEKQRKKNDRRMVEIELMGFFFLVISGMTGFLGMNVVVYNTQPHESVIISWSTIGFALLTVLMVAFSIYGIIKIYSAKKGL